MADKLVIVESPSKAETISKYLGKGYSVTASMGHIIDLPRSNIGIDIENDFEPKYITIRGKGELLNSLKKVAKNAKKVYLATDPDREGEAISWHLARALNIDMDSECRVCFNEITKTAVKKAMNEPRKIDSDLVDAQQARRVLDRIVGYKISPILWAKIKKGLSAGRVQSVAVRMICDREDEIEAFVPREFWDITAIFEDVKTKKQFKAYLIEQNGGKKEFKNEDEANSVLAKLKGAKYAVSDVKVNVNQRIPAPPFTTSTLQQEASRKLNFQSKKTMQVAQGLYEGIELNKNEKVGLITYMRTDSLRISNEAVAAVRGYIGESYGDKYLPKSARVFKTKKNAQDAHEAIRPTDVTLTPASIKNKLSNDQYKLYKLVWERFVACQMEAAVIENIACDIKGGEYVFRANGSRVLFDGFMKVYVEGTDSENEEKKTTLPALEVGDAVLDKGIDAKQHFTQPPQRFTEATLIKLLEEKGIGRPSTYMPTITTILARGYVVREKKSFLPTELGRVTTELLKNNFKDIVDLKFTANMESRLDDVETGKVEWKEILRDFYPPFDKVLKKAESEVSKVKIQDEVSDVACEKCGRMMVYKMGKYGKFLACPGFPACSNAKPIRIETGVKCPKCGKEILQKKSKKGKIYFGCEENPKCDFMTWDTPLKDKKCPKCGGIMLEKKFGGKVKEICANQACGYGAEEGKK